jgi:glutamate 5-kinase
VATLTEAQQSPLRLTAARRVVVKIGSALLVDRATGKLRQDWLTGLA